MFTLAVRSSCDCVLSMGTGALKSPTHWAQVKRWRKIERYIALGRHCLQLSPGYKQWDCFDFDDHVNRNDLIKTFEKRHLPLSDGNDELNFHNLYNYKWKQPVSKAKAQVKTDPDTPEGAVNSVTVSVKSTPPTMVYDVDLGCLVAFE